MRKCGVVSVSLFLHVCFVSIVSFFESTLCAPDVDFGFGAGFNCGFVYYCLNLAVALQWAVWFYSTVACFGVFFLCVSLLFVVVEYLCVVSVDDRFHVWSCAVADFYRVSVEYFLKVVFSGSRKVFVY